MPIFRRLSILSSCLCLQPHNIVLPPIYTAAFLSPLKRSMSLSAMSKRLSGKIVLITGASSGIGKSTAIEFSRTAPEVKLILAARRTDALQEVAKTIHDESNGKTKVKTMKLDVSDSKDIQRFYKELEAEEEWKNVDVLVNNAGLVKGMEHVGDIAEEDLNIMFATNVTGLVNMTQGLLPLFKSRNSGDIINIGSIAGREAYVGGSIYCATKAAVRYITNSMRKELINTRIRVIEVDPGQVETEFSEIRFRGDKEKAKAVYAGGEPLTPEDVAEVIVFAAGRRENVVIAETLMFPSHQAGTTIYKK